MTTPRPTPPNPAPRDEVSTATLQPAPLAEPNYDAFGLWLDAELAKLVAQYQHLASPNASKPISRRQMFY